LAGNLNQFMDEVFRAINGNLNFQNLDRQVKTFSVKIDGSGLVVSPPQIKMTINSKPSGINIISATNLDSSSTYPTTAPFISYTFSEQLMTIKNISGLQPNSNYSLTIEIIGS
jgi:hypothetical protein